MFGFLLFAAALAATSPSAPAAIPLGQLDHDIDTVSASVDGRSGQFLFDSGSGMLQLTPDFAAEVGCTPWGKLTGFRAQGDRLDSQRCNPMAVTVGPSRPTVVSEPAISDLRHMLGKLGEGLSGVVALDAFNGEVITLSLHRRQIIVETPQSAARIAQSATEAPIRLVRDAQGAALTADMGVPTRLGMLWMEIDTGNPGPDSIDKTIAPLLGLESSSTGVQQIDTPLAGSARLTGSARVGDFIFDGNLGRGFLLQWDVTLDLAHGRGWIRPAKSTT